MPSSTLPLRRERESTSSLKSSNSANQKQQQHQQQISLEDAVNALLVTFSKENQNPDWIQISAKIYSTLKVWYSPEILRDQYFKYLMECENSSENGNDTNETQSSAEKRDGRTIAVEKTIDLARKLKGIDDSSSQGNENDDDDETFASLLKVKKEEESSSSEVKNESSSSSMTSGEKLESNNNINTITVTINSTISSSSSSSIFPSNNLIALWNIPQSQEFLLEMLFLVQNLPDSTVFNLNVAPRVQASLHYAPIGKPYADVVYQPNCLQNIRDKINATFQLLNASSSSSITKAQQQQALMILGGNLNANGIKTLCQLYVELSKMIANCIMFNLPGGSYPMIARGFMRNIMAVWADHVAKTEH